MKMRLRNVLCLIGLMALAFVLGSCKKSRNTTPPPVPPVGPTPSTEKELKWDEGKWDEKEWR